MFAKVSTTWERQRKRGEHWIIIGSGGIPTARLSGERRLLNEPRAVRWKDGGAFEEEATVKDASGNNKRRNLPSCRRCEKIGIESWKTENSNKNRCKWESQRRDTPLVLSVKELELKVENWKFKWKSCNTGITNERPSLLSSQWESCYLLLPAAAAAALPKFDCFLLPFLLTCWQQHISNWPAQPDENNLVKSSL